MGNHIFSWALLFPFVGALFQLTAKRGSPFIAPALAVALSLCSSVLIWLLLFGFADVSTEPLPWIFTSNQEHAIKMSGLGSLVFVCVSIMFPLLLALTWGDKQNRPGKHALLLLLQAALLGALGAEDLFLFFVFWAFSTIPFYFLVLLSLDNSSANELKDGEFERVAFRSLVSSWVGNVFLLVSIVIIYFCANPNSFNFEPISGGVRSLQVVNIWGFHFSVSWVAYLFFLLGMGFRLPVWPLHINFLSVIRKASAAPIAAGVGGVFLVGACFYVRVTYTVFRGEFDVVSPLLLGFGVAGALISSVVAATQNNFRSFFGYALSATMGVQLAGASSGDQTGVSGALFLSAASGIAFAGLAFLFQVLGKASHEIWNPDSLDGRFLESAIKRPWILIFSSALFLSAIGVPGFAGFFGNSYVLMGVFSMGYWPFCALAMTMVILSYAFVRMFRFIFLSKQIHTETTVPGALWSSQFLAPLASVTFLLGIFPKFALDWLGAAMRSLLTGAF